MATKRPRKGSGVVSKTAIGSGVTSPGVKAVPHKPLVTTYRNKAGDIAGWSGRYPPEVRLGGVATKAGGPAWKHEYSGSPMLKRHPEINVTAKFR